ALVTGDVDDLDGESVRLLEKGEAEIDGDAPRLLLGQTVGVDAGQGFDERGFAVVDVSRGADDYCSGGRVFGFHRRWPVRGAEWLRLPAGFIECTEWCRLYPRFTEDAEWLRLSSGLIEAAEWLRLYPGFTEDAEWLRLSSGFIEAAEWL